MGTDNIYFLRKRGGRGGRRGRGGGRRMLLTTFRLLVARQDDLAQSMRSVSPGKCGKRPPLHHRRMGSSLLARRSLLPGPAYEPTEANSISDRALWGWKAPRSAASRESCSSGKEAKETQTQQRAPRKPRHMQDTSLPRPAI